MLKGSDSGDVMVVEGGTFSLECEVVVGQDIDSKVTIMWKHQDMVLQADDIRLTIVNYFNIYH